MQFDTNLRRLLFSYYPDTFAELLESPSLPMGVVASPERLTVDDLIDECGEPDMHTLSAEHRAGVVSLRKSSCSWALGGLLAAVKAPSPPNAPPR